MISQSTFNSAGCAAGDMISSQLTDRNTGSDYISILMGQKITLSC